MEGVLQGVFHPARTWEYTRRSQLSFEFLYHAFVRSIFFVTMHHTVAADVLLTTTCDENDPGRTCCFQRGHVSARPLACELEAQPAEVGYVHISWDLDEPQLVDARRGLFRQQLFIHDGVDCGRHVFLRGLVAPARARCEGEGGRKVGARERQLKSWEEGDDGRKNTCLGGLEVSS